MFVHVRGCMYIVAVSNPPKKMDDRLTNLRNLPSSQTRCTQVAAFAQANGYKPHLAIVTVGERPPEEAQRCVG